MVDLCRVNFLEHLKKYGGGPGGKRGLIILDAASSHLRPCVRKCIEDELNCDLAVIPASMTHKLQCIDTHVGKSFKDGMYYAWANWMLSGFFFLRPWSYGNLGRSVEAVDVDRPLVEARSTLTSVVEVLSTST